MSDEVKVLFFRGNFRKDFEPLKNDRILKVASYEKPDKLPIWIMGQVGSCMEEYQRLYKSQGMFGLCQNPEVISRLAILPTTVFDLDAVIIHSNTFVIPHSLGLMVEFKIDGPKLPKPFTTSMINDLNTEGAVNRLKYIADAINLTRLELKGEVPVIGFTEGPWTLMSYMIEGGESDNFSNARKWLYSLLAHSHRLLNLLTDVIIEHLVQQVDAGAQLLQVSERNTQYLNEYLFENFCAPYLKRIQTEVKMKLQEKHLSQVPMILFAKGAHYALRNLRYFGYEIIGIDATIVPQHARSLLGDTVLQGNIDPGVFYASYDEIILLAKETILNFGCDHYIFNVGQDIHPGSSGDAIKTLIDAVHSLHL